MTRAQAMKNALRWGFTAEERKEIRRFFDDKERQQNANEWLKVTAYPPSRAEVFVYDQNPFLASIPMSKTSTGAPLRMPQVLDP
jgi:hypothetical protein